MKIFFSIGIYSVNPLSIQKQCNYCQIDCCHTSKWQVDVVRGTTDWSTSASASFYVPWCWVRHANICALGHKLDCTIIPILPYWGMGHQSIRDSYTPTAKAFLLWNWPRKPYTMLIDGNCRVFLSLLAGFLPTWARQPPISARGTFAWHSSCFRRKISWKLSHFVWRRHILWEKTPLSYPSIVVKAGAKSRVLFNSLVIHDFQWELSIHSLYRSLVWTGPEPGYRLYNLGE